MTGWNRDMLQREYLARAERDLDLEYVDTVILSVMWWVESSGGFVFTLRFNSQGSAEKGVCSLTTYA